MAIERTWQISAPGKALLLGEYAVLEGAPALVTALERRILIQVTTLPKSKQSGLLRAPPILAEAVPMAAGPAGRQQLANVSPLLAAVLHVAEPLCQQDHWPAFELCIDSQALYWPDGAKMGIGSSAALTVAMLAALYVLFAKQPVTTLAACLPAPASFWAQAQQAHQLAQNGRGSGVDVATSQLGGVLQFTNPEQQRDPLGALVDAARSPDGPSMVPLAAWPQLPMAVVRLSKPIATAGMVGRLMAWKQDHLVAYKHWMEQLMQLSQQGLLAWRQQSVPMWLATMERYQQTLWQLAAAANLPLQTTEQVRLQQLVRQFGGAYKSSGAGGGDIGLVAAPDQDSWQQLCQALAQEGFELLPISMQEEGLSLHAVGV